jgi:hypothetical protein
MPSGPAVELIAETSVEDVAQELMDRLPEE